MGHSEPGLSSKPMTRRDWERAYLLLMRPIVSHASPGRARIRLPGGRPSRNGPEIDSLEAFARSLWMSGPWLSTHPTGEAPIAGRLTDIAAFYRQGLISGTDPRHPESWFPLLSTKQTLVEAAALAWNLWLARARLWDPLGSRERRSILAWFEEVSAIEPWDNNWRLFSVVLLTVSKFLGGRFDQAVIDAHLDRVESFYLGDGWYNDGPPNPHNWQIDYYNAFVLHPYLLYWCWLDGDSQPARRERIFDRARQFQQSFVHWFGSDGSFPCFGRSTLYRMGVTHVFPWAVLAGACSLPLGQVRRLCGLTLRRALETTGVLRADGQLTMGFAREYLPMIEHSGPGSPYWGAKAFGVLAIPPQHSFWTTPEKPLPVERGDYLLATGPPGFLVRGDRATGHVQVVNGKSLHLSKKYSNLAYSTHFGYEIDRPRKLDEPDPFGEAGLTLSRDARLWYGRIAVRSLHVEDGVLITAATYRLGVRPWASTATVLSGVVFVGDQQIRVHRVKTKARVLAREGGFACGWEEEGEPELIGRLLSYARTPRAASGIRGLFGYERTPPPLRTDNNVLFPHSCVPHVETARAKRGILLLGSVASDSCSSSVAVGVARGPLAFVATNAASPVVMGTEATSPMLPTSVRTTSSATSSVLSTDPNPLSDTVNRIRSGRDAPAYARTRVLTVDAMWSLPMRMPAR